MSTTPCYPDQAEKYDQIASSTTSEFIDYSGSVNHISRGSFPINLISNDSVSAVGATGTANFTTEITEPLMINPMIFDHSWWRRAGITQITNYKSTSNLIHMLYRIDYGDMI
jgi:hypothetical protein